MSCLSSCCYSNCALQTTGCLPLLSFLVWSQIDSNSSQSRSILLAVTAIAAEIADEWIRAALVPVFVLVHDFFDLYTIAQEDRGVDLFLSELAKKVICLPFQLVSTFLLSAISAVVATIFHLANSFFSLIDRLSTPVSHKTAFFLSWREQVAEAEREGALILVPDDWLKM